jgi:tetratricopeptide (TPR) repeat protein
MKTGGHDEALRELLADLPAGHELYLVHLANCTTCQERLTSSLAEPERPSSRNTSYTGLFTRLEEDTAQLIEKAGQRVDEAQALLAQLLSHPRDQQHKALRETRFQSRFLLEVLLDQSQTAVPRDPENAVSLAGLASHLAARLQRIAPDDEDLALLFVRAESLAGNAHRLGGRWAEAETALGRADHGLAFCWGQSCEEAAFWRALGLLRWEQGRLSRAEGHLRQSARLFGELELSQEQAASRILLGLLYLERDRPDRAVRLLQAGRAILDPGIRPWLAVRAGLSAAIGLADLHQVELACTALEESWRLYARVQDEREVVRISWLEGKLFARVGQHDQAEQLLDATRRNLRSECSFPEAAVCSLDLAVLLAQVGRSAELRRLVEDLEATFSAELGLDVVRRLAQKLGKTLGSSSEHPHNLYARSVATLRRSLRFRGYRVEGLPFA